MVKRISKYYKQGSVINIANTLNIRYKYTNFTFSVKVSFLARSFLGTSYSFMFILVNHCECLSN